MTLSDYPPFKAAILVEQRRELVVDEVALPERLDAGQVLVKVYASGICGSQLGEIDGIKGPDRFLPHLLGHEGSGRVLAVGPGVRQVREGQRVVMHWRRGAGMESAPPAYRWGGRRLNAGWVTTFNELAVVSENRLTPIPDGFEVSLAALFGCPVTTGLGVVINDARLIPGESIVVLGAGGVGLSIIQGAALVSAHPIVAVDLFASKLSLARKLGATHTIDASSGDVEAEARAALGDEGADVVVDNTGDVELIERAYELAHGRGRVVLVGVPSAERKASISTLPLHFGKVLTGSHGGSASPDRDIPRLIGLCRAGKLDLEALVTDRCSLEQINVAIRRMRRGEVAGRCLLEIAKPEGRESCR